MCTIHRSGSCTKRTRVRIRRVTGSLTGQKLIICILVHDLNQAREIEHLKFFRLVQYRTEELPFGVNYFGKVAVDDKGHCIHVRVFKGAEGAKFHSVHTRPTVDGGAVFGVGRGWYIRSSSSSSR